MRLPLQVAVIKVQANLSCRHVAADADLTLHVGLQFDTTSMRNHISLESVVVIVEFLE